MHGRDGRPTAAQTAQIEVDGSALAPGDATAAEVGRSSPPGTDPHPPLPLGRRPPSFELAATRPVLTARAQRPTCSTPRACLDIPLTSSSSRLGQPGPGRWITVSRTAPTPGSSSPASRWTPPSTAVARTRRQRATLARQPLANLQTARATSCDTPRNRQAPPPPARRRDRPDCVARRLRRHPPGSTAAWTLARLAHPDRAPTQ